MPCVTLWGANPQKRLSLRQYFGNFINYALRRKRLGQVMVGAVFKAGVFIDILAFRSQKYERDFFQILIVFNFLAYFKTGNFRHHYIAYDKVRQFIRYHGNRFFAVTRGYDVKSGFF